MEVSEFTLKLIIILIPGAIACIIYEKLTIHRKWSPFTFISNSMIMGAMSYLLAQLIFFYLFNDNSFYTFWANLTLKEIPYLTICKASGVSVVIGFLGSGIDRFKIINDFATTVGLTNKYGDENLFTYFLNNKEINEIYIRDLTTNQTYHGMIVSFSETDDIKEIVLRNAKVYDYVSSKYLYDIKYVYLARSKDALTIEVFPNYIEIDQDGKQTTT
jgi:hypothetical protein